MSVLLMLGWFPCTRLGGCWREDEQVHTHSPLVYIHKNPRLYIIDSKGSEGV
jgi:hypothetical protein